MSLRLFKRLCFLIPLLLFACVNEAAKELEKQLEFEFQKLKSPTNSSIRGIWVLDSTSIWLSGAKGTVIRSLDAGDSWQLLPAPDIDSLDFRDIHAFSKESALVVSAGYPARV